MENLTEPRVALVGYGNWGRNLARGLHESGLLALVCESHEGRAAQARRDMPQLEVATDFDSILARHDIHAIALATPAPTHEKLAHRVLDAHKDVFVEKPFTLKSEAAVGLAQKAEAAGRICMVGHILEYAPAFEALLQEVRQPQFGAVRSVRCQRLQLGKVRTFENAFWSLAPHDVSVLLQLADAEPARVLCIGQAMMQPEVEDQVYCHLGFDSGVNGMIHASWMEPDRLRRVTVVGERRMAIWDDLPQPSVRVWDWTRGPASEGLIPAEQGEVRTISLSNQSPLQAMAAQLRAALSTRRPPRSDAWDGVRVVRVLEAAEASLRAGGIWQEVR